MRSAILYNVFVCWTVAGMGSLLARHILTMRKQDDGDRAFGFFWLLSGALWTTSGLRQFALYLGYPGLDEKLFFVVQAFLAGHIVFGVVFLSHKMIKNQAVIRNITKISVVLALIFFAFSLIFGIKKTLITSWGSDHLLTGWALVFFAPLYAYCLAMTVYAIIKQVFRGLMRSDFSRGETLAFAAILLYEVAGIIDVKGSVADFRLVVIRSLYMISALVAFLSYSWESSSMILYRTEQGE